MSRTIEVSEETYQAFVDWIRRHGRDGETIDEALAYLMEEELSRDGEASMQWRLQRA